MEIDGVKLIQLPKILDERGNLSFLEGLNHIPFEIMRTYWIYDVPGGQVRGGHSYRINEEFIIALSGSFDVILKDGQNEQIISLNRSYVGLYVPNGIWRHMENFSTNSLAFIAASTKFSEEDYERDFNKFSFENSK
ncbi:sugar 3,4-ketoisomerase [Pedobacter agri]|jgi:oxalate decarboxylase/phosphoglucose isomerase-like protein (cupin superfamily)|uniref:FdtA/QdtA family cupin domain-containing protein n=1 Tax=Pedobacter agri TaxID=454586 RepID=A0A9X3DB78_9SPHI|nr:FdtA/QdtA family cupin domain-containing protein [Pedobacter agri]MCX3264084.1 FdtA/QdtA family cupin domain-containing protein [Pedobacter agri]